MEKHVSKLEVGDETPWYEVIGLPDVQEDGSVHVPIRWKRDEGLDMRVFDEDVRIMVTDR